MDTGDFERVVESYQKQIAQITAAQNAVAAKRNSLLEDILTELRAIRKDQEIMKDAILYAPSGPGAAAARDSFDAQLNQ